MSGFILTAYIIFGLTLLGLGLYLLWERRRTLARLKALERL